MLNFRGGKGFSVHSGSTCTLFMGMVRFMRLPLRGFRGFVAQRKGSFRSIHFLPSKRRLCVEMWSVKQGGPGNIEVSQSHDSTIESNVSGFSYY